MTESEFRDWVRAWLSALDGRIKVLEGRPAGARGEVADVELRVITRGLKERIEALEAERRGRLARLHEARRKAKGEDKGAAA